MDENSIPRLKKDDPLFKKDEDWWHNAFLNFLSDSLSLYIEGYKLASDLLVEHIKVDHGDIDFLVYPIVFLYRQYLELQLKEIIKDGNKLLDIQEKYPKTHDIDKLWKMCREILEKFLLGYFSEDLDVVEECINEFSKTDPKSETFRYPTDKHGKKTLPFLKYINLRNLSEVMERIASFLEAASISISIDLENKENMEN